MAEVTGLVVGTVGLAALFQTCIELFERFELGRNHARDYQLACTKIDLLQARLSQWGEQFRVEAPGLEHPALRQNWTQEQEVIARSLIGIRDIFESASILAARYKLSSGTIGHCSRDIEHKVLLFRLSRWTIAGKRTLWAVRDKSKLDDFIDDLSFLIDNLDKVGTRIAMSAANKSMPRKSVPKAENDQQNKTRSSKTSTPRVGAPDGKMAAEKEAEPRVSVLTKEERDAVVQTVGKHGGQFHINRTLHVEGGSTIVGSVGKESTSLITQGETVRVKDSFAILGSVRNGKDLRYVAQAHRRTIVAEEEVSDSSTDSESSQETLQAHSNDGKGY